MKHKLLGIVELLFGLSLIIGLVLWEYTQSIVINDTRYVICGVVFGKTLSLYKVVLNIFSMFGLLTFGNLAIGDGLRRIFGGRNGTNFNFTYNYVVWR